jgi:hypothetical protein
MKPPDGIILGGVNLRVKIEFSILFFGFSIVISPLASIKPGVATKLLV